MHEHHPTVYTEKFNLCTTQANLDNPALRKRIVAFVRALITAAQRLKDDPQSGWKLVAQTAKLDIDTVSGAWPRFKYPGARPLFIYIKNAHANAIPAVRAYAAEWVGRYHGRGRRGRRRLRAWHLRRARSHGRISVRGPPVRRRLFPYPFSRSSRSPTRCS